MRRGRARACAQKLRKPSAQDRRRAGRVGEAGQKSDGHQEDGRRTVRPEREQAEEAGRVAGRQHQQDPRPPSIDEPSHDRCSTARPERHRPGDCPRHRERAGLLTQKEDDRKRVDAERQPRDHRRTQQPPHSRVAEMRRYAAMSQKRRSSDARCASSRLQGGVVRPLTSWLLETGLGDVRLPSRMQDVHVGAVA